MSQIPHLLSACISHSAGEDRLTLLTSVLGASTNWLVLRFLQSFLHHGGSKKATAVGDEDAPLGQDDVSVVLVSFLRDMAFWKDSAKKLNMDLERLSAMKRFTFIDGLSGLYLPHLGPPTSTSEAHNMLRSADLASIQSQIQEALRTSKANNDNGKVILVIDQLDLLLATSCDKVSAVAISNMLLELRQATDATVLTLAADNPFMSSQTTPLESSLSGLLLSVAHQADQVISLRLLDTGTARDVSGVCRINVESEGDCQEAQKLESQELLYLVGGDGGVKVFERG